MPATQHIAASITISGQQDTAISSHDRGSGSYISVSTSLDFARLLPSDGSTDWRNQQDAESARPVPTGADGPALYVDTASSEPAAAAPRAVSTSPSGRISRCRFNGPPAQVWRSRCPVPSCGY